MVTDIALSNLTGRGVRIALRLPSGVCGTALKMPQYKENTP